MFCNNLVSFNVFKMDSITRKGLPGAVFKVFDFCGNVVDGGITDLKGNLKLCLPICSLLELKEIQAPVGYCENDRCYQIWIDECGRTFVNGCFEDVLVIKNDPIIRASFTAIKVNKKNNQPLAGAKYTLFKGDIPIAKTSSNINGEVTFNNLLPGIYKLIEIEAPLGYRIDNRVLTVIVNKNGEITINNQPANNYHLTNIQYRNLTITKIDDDTELPLADGVFHLMQNGTLLQEVTSDVNGILDFGLVEPGEYDLIEYQAPTGYTKKDDIFKVVITDDFDITIDTIPLDDFFMRNVRIIP